MTNSLQTLGQSKPLYPALPPRAPSTVHSIESSTSLSSFPVLQHLSQSTSSSPTTATRDWVDLSHPIDVQPEVLCKEVLHSCEKMPLNEKIKRCEQAIAEMDPLLDTALRHHFYQGLLDQQTSEIIALYHSHLELPKELFDKEDALLKFAEKNPQSSTKLSVALFGSFLNRFISESPDISSHKSMKQSIESYNHFIQDKLINFERAKRKSQRGVICKLELHESHPYTFKNFEFKIRQELATRLISRQAEIFKAQFKKTGTITSEEMKEAANAILCFANNNPCVSPLQELLSKTFDVEPLGSFEELGSTIFNKTEKWLQQVAIENSSNASGLLKGLARLTYRPIISEKEREEYTAHSRRQLDTIAWAKEEWKPILLWNQWMERVKNNPSSAIHETPLPNEEQYEMDEWDYNLLFHELKETTFGNIVTRWGYINKVNE